MRIRRLNHSVYQIQYHIVWGTKYRRKVIKQYVRSELIKNVYKTLRRHPDWYMDKINTGSDHVHMLMEIPPKYKVSDVIREIKSSSSAHLRKKFKFLDRIYTKGSLWSTGYFVSTVGLNEETIKKYIDSQNSYERGKDVTREFS